MDFPYVDALIRSRNGTDLPRPFRCGGAVAAIGLLPLALGLADVIRPLSGLVFAAIFLAVGLLQSSLAYAELITIRRRADIELRRKAHPYLLSSVAQWYANELTADRHRLALARSVARTERNLSPARLPGASPLNRVAARPHGALLRQLSVRLEALDQPVTPQAMLQVEEVLTSPESPLYRRDDAADIRRSLLQCLAALNTTALPTGLGLSAHGIGDCTDEGR